jgi:photosystem II stability/assembly factor-like uncharacterized protein
MRHLPVPGSGIYRSTDSGETWEPCDGHGLPDGPWGRSGVAVSADGQRVYALIEAKQSGLYVSNDGGQNWAACQPRSASYQPGLVLQSRHSRSQRCQCNLYTKRCTDVFSRRGQDRFRACAARPEAMTTMNCGSIRRTERISYLAPIREPQSASTTAKLGQRGTTSQPRRCTT